MNSLKKTAMKRPLWAITLLLILGPLSACAQETTSPAQSLGTSSPSATATPKPSETGTLLAATLTKLPTMTLLPTSTTAAPAAVVSTPYPLQTLTLGTPGPGVPLAEEAISLSNVDLVRQQARLGKGVITDSSYAPIANLLAVATSLGVCVYDGRTLAEVRCIDTGGWTFSVAISSDGHTLAASTIDGIRLWHVDDGASLLELKAAGYSDVARLLAFSPDGKTVASVIPGAGFVNLWRVKDGVLLQTLKGEVQGYGSPEIMRLAFSTDGKTLAALAGTVDQSLMWWRMTDGVLINTVDMVTDFAFSANGQIVASVEENAIQLWQAVDGQFIGVLEGPMNGEIEALAFSADGKTLAAATDSIFLWSLEDRKLLRTLDGFDEPINALAFAPNGRTLASGSLNNAVVRIWQVNSGALLITSQGAIPSGRNPGNIPGYINQLWWTSNDVLLQELSEESGIDWMLGLALPGLYGEFIKPFNRTARLLLVSDGTQLHSLEDHVGAAETLAFSPNGQILASGFSDGTIRFWRVGDFAPLRSIHQGSEVTSLGFSQDSQYLASSGRDGGIRLWRISDGALVYRLEQPDGLMCSLAFSPDGQVLATAGTKVQLWNASDGTLIRTLEKWEGFTYNVEVDFSSDGKTLAASADGMLRVWRVIDGAVLWKAGSDESFASPIDFAPDGTTLAVGFMSDPSLSNKNLNGYIRDTTDGRILFSLATEEDIWSKVNSLAFSPDGHLLASYGEQNHDIVVRLWNAQDGTSLRSMEGHRSIYGGIEESLGGIGGYSGGMGISHEGAVSFSPDGLWLASASADGTVIIWAVIPPEKSTQMVSDTGDVSCALRRNQLVHLSGDANLWSTPDASKASIVSTATGDAIWIIRSGPKWGKITAEINGWWWEVSQSADGPSDGWVWEGRIQECQ